MCRSQKFADIPLSTMILFRSSHSGSNKKCWEYCFRSTGIVVLSNVLLEQHVTNNGEDTLLMKSSAGVPLVARIPRNSDEIALLDNAVLDELHRSAISSSSRREATKQLL